MKPADGIPGARGVGQASAPRAGERPGPARPARARDEPAGLDATAEYIATDATAPPRRSPAGAECPGFLDPPRSPDELGWLANYRVLGLLGQGGMGLVYEAEDADLLRKVALKVIRPELAASPQIAQRFLIEARAMAALKHDHIVTIYQVGQHRGVPFLAMEYLWGMSLDRWLDQGHVPTADQVLRLGREVAVGLDAAHRRGVVHRDIKPANLWLEAPTGRVKILDFGLARAEGQDVQITSPGATVGSPAYMAPELAQGARGDASSDLFSLGCVLYLLSTRRLPFDGSTLVAVLTSLATETPPAPRAIDPDIPPDLDELIVHLLARTPAGRPESARAVIEAIRRIERRRQAERRSAGHAQGSPTPIVVDHHRPMSDRVVADSTSPGRPEAAGRARRGLWAAALAIPLGVAAITMSLHWRPRRAVSTAMAGRASALPASGPGREAPRRPAPSPEAAVAGPARAVPLPPPAVHVLPAPGRPPAVARPVRDEAAQAAAPGLDPPGRRAPAAEKPAMGAAAGRIEAFGDRSRIVDPDGDCQVLRDEPNGRASILVPGTAHLLSAEIDRMNAPRILREAAGDFEVRVRVRGIDAPGSRAATSRYAPYHGGGILIWKNPGHYLRLEIAADHRKTGTYPYANLELRQDARLSTSWGIKIDDRSTYLRIVRRGREIRAAFSPDGEHWTPFATIDPALPDRVEVGVVAINSSAKPLKAEFEEFHLLFAPAARIGEGAVVGAPAPPSPSPVPAAQVPEDPPAPTGSTPHRDH